MTAFFGPYTEYGAEWLPILAEAALTTIMLSLAGFALAALLGLGLALMQVSSHAPLRRIAGLYVTVVRGVPLLAVLFLIYFGLPGIGLTFNAFSAAVIGLGLCFAAQMAEVYRSGLAAIPRGQREAAMAVGMAPVQAFVFITLPQALRIILSPVIVTFVSLVKDSSLASLITVNELVLTGRAMATEYFLPLQIYVAVGLFYFAIAWPFSLLSSRLAVRFGT